MGESAAAVRGLDAKGAVLRALIRRGHRHAGPRDGRTVGRDPAPGHRGRQQCACREATTEYIRTRIGAGKLPHLTDARFSELLYNDDPEASFECGVAGSLAQ
ncbi:hypothetical protein OG407_23770 [Streptomyces sp. NBC_01515]|uniref:hypothetical protein n=1 Tax=Streptomyces sp. NBC_01515 TaxID=2903890 RepID=UPI00386E60F1